MHRGENDGWQWMQIDIKPNISENLLTLTSHNRNYWDPSNSIEIMKIKKKLDKKRTENHAIRLNDVSIADRIANVKQ